MNNNDTFNSWSNTKACHLAAQKHMAKHDLTMCPSSVCVCVSMCACVHVCVDVHYLFCGCGSISSIRKASPGAAGWLPEIGQRVRGIFAPPPASLTLGRPPSHSTSHPNHQSSSCPPTPPFPPPYRPPDRQPGRWRRRRRGGGHGGVMA